METDPGAAPTADADADGSPGKGAQATEPNEPETEGANTEAETEGANTLGQTTTEGGAIGVAPASHFVGLGGPGCNPTPDPQELTKPPDPTGGEGAKSVSKSVLARGTEAAAAAAAPEPYASKSNGEPAQAAKPDDEGATATPATAAATAKTTTMTAATDVDANAVGARKDDTRAMTSNAGATVPTEHAPTVRAKAGMPAVQLPEGKVMNVLLRGGLVEGSNITDKISEYSKKGAEKLKDTFMEIHGDLLNDDGD